MTLFRVCAIEAGVQADGADVAAKVAVGSLSNEEVGNMYYDQFQEQQLAGNNS